MTEWTNKDKRQYKDIKECAMHCGKSEDNAEEIAARTVNKQRRREGRTPNKTTQGTGNPNQRYEDRSVEELRNLAAESDIEGRSKLNKDGLIEAIRAKR